MHIPLTVSLHFLRFREGEFVQQTRASLVFDDFPQSHDPNVLSRDDLIRNYMPVAPWGLRVKRLVVKFV